MPNETNLLLAAIVVLLVVTVSLLIAIVRRPRTITYELSLDPTFREQIEALGRSTQRHVDISVVVELLNQIEQQPDDIVERLREYPAAVQAAAWLHYIDRLGADLQHGQIELSKAHRKDFSRYHNGESLKRTEVQQAQRHVDDLRAKLDKAIAASGQKTGPRAL